LHDTSVCTCSYYSISIICSTSLYGAGIWGLSQADKLERVQQQFFKRILNLPNCAPRYFVRLETGRPHVSLEVFKLSLNLLHRILSSPVDSLLYESFINLKRISCIFPEHKYSWCLQVHNMLVRLNYGYVFERNSANLLFFS